jgi:hypothetical protein
VLRRADAVWVTSWPKPKFVKHEWGGAWECSMFRNEGQNLSSTLIRQAVAATRWHYGSSPDLGMITFVDASEVESNNPGYCYECAGFERVGYTQAQCLHVWQLDPEDMPDPCAPNGATQKLAL